MIATTGGRNR